MGERPILFSGPMVRAILEGRKTMTRRVVKPVGNDGGFVLQDYGKGWWPYRSDDGESPMKGDTEIPHACPYGQPGDRLWVRETFIHEPADYCWEASVSIPCRLAMTVYRADHSGDTRGAGWTPSIHMPRALSRITLEVIGVRVERLQDIGEEDAMAEGIQVDVNGHTFTPDDGIRRLGPRTAFCDLWQSINNGPSSWYANPWVWVIEFKRI